MDSEILNQDADLSADIGLLADVPAADVMPEPELPDASETEVYQTNQDGFFVGVTVADVDPMDPENLLIPAGCVTVAPPALGDLQAALWRGDAWQIVDIVPTTADPAPAPVPMLIGDIRAAAVALMAARIDAFTAQFTAGVPAAELASWPTKAIEAQLVLDGGQSAMIAAEAAALGVTDQEVAATIAAKSAQYQLIIGAVSGFRRKTVAAIEIAETQADVDAALQAALVEAAAMAASMGLVF